MNVKSVLPSFLGENTYEFTLIDERTNKIKQKVISHNLITKGFWNSQAQNRDGWGSCDYQVCAPYGFSLGDGIGSPSFEDSSLFHELWENEKEDSISYVFDDDFSVKATIVYTFPANSSYIGDITEAGLRINTGEQARDTLMSHCMLTDAEGNLITINKTENDKLKVSVIYQIILPKKSGDFIFLPIKKGFWKNLYKFIGKKHGNDEGGNGIFYDSSLCLLRNRKPKNTISGNPPGLGVTNASKTYNVKEIIYNTQRMETSTGNNHYYYCLSIHGLGYYSLPNQEIFPKYTIKSIDIGIGDGETLSFKNPLNYFVKDSDIIYINGQPKKRNVDYTIDSDNNFDMLNELSAGNWIKKIYSEADKDFNRYKTESIPFFLPSEGGRNGYHKDSGRYWDEDLGGKGLKINIPMFIELEEIKKINTCCIKNVSYGGYYDYNTDISIKLEYSQNGQEYKEAFTSDVFNSKTGKTFKFDVIEALYWKMTLLSVSNDNKDDFAWVYGLQDQNNPFLGYVGDDKITFKVPPAKDDIITMDVQMDVPFKNENYSIDTSATLEFV